MTYLERFSAMIFYILLSLFIATVVKLTNGSVTKSMQMLLGHRRDNINARQSVYQQTTLDEETIEQLRRLGYVE